MLTWYTLQENDRITEVGGDWDDFAEQNEGAAVVAKNVLGRSIWDFIQGDDETAMFRSILFTCRLTGETLDLMSDCSSGDVERVMRMKVVPLYEHRVRVEHKLVEDIYAKARARH